MNKLFYTNVKIGYGFWLSLLFVFIGGVGVLLATDMVVSGQASLHGVSGFFIVGFSLVATIATVLNTFSAGNFIIIEEGKLTIKDVVKNGWYVVAEQDNTGHYMAFTKHLFRNYAVFNFAGHLITGTSPDDIKKKIEGHISLASITNYKVKKIHYTPVEEVRL